MTGSSCKVRIMDITLSQDRYFIGRILFALRWYRAGSSFAPCSPRYSTISRGSNGPLDLGAYGGVCLFENLVRTDQFEPHDQAGVLNAVPEANGHAERITAEEWLHSDVELFRDLQLTGFAGLTVDLLVVGQLDLAVVEPCALAEADVLLGFEGAADFEHVCGGWGIRDAFRGGDVLDVVFKGIRRTLPDPSFCDPNFSSGPIQY